MPGTYAGDPSAITARQVVSVTTPADGEQATVASILAAVKKEADVLKWLMDNMLLADTVTALSITAGNGTAGTPPPKAVTIGKQTYLTGRITAANSGGSGTKLFTLPSGQRPAANLIILPVLIQNFSGGTTLVTTRSYLLFSNAAQTYLGFGGTLIMAAGDVYMDQTSAATGSGYIDLDGISYFSTAP